LKADDIGAMFFMRGGLRFGNGARKKSILKTAGIATVAAFFAQVAAEAIIMTTEAATPETRVKM
jgi:hypothetical protein